MHCQYCEAAFTPKRTTGEYCSARCRCAAWQRRRVALPVAEARAIRARLAAALEAVWDAKNTLERYGG